MGERDSIYGMKLHEEKELKGGIVITRVAGGWIYSFPNYHSWVGGNVFVPFDYEFMENGEEK